MIPTMQDWQRFRRPQQVVLWQGPEPQFDRWTYWEKFDYFAVFWGVAIIGASGLVMWFPVFFTRFLPGWLINIALIVHSDEALLAAGFIFSIHFFNTHFRIEKFPMDTVIFSGRVSKTEMLHERRRWYDRLVAEGRLDELRVKDEWVRWKNIARAVRLLLLRPRRPPAGPDYLRHGGAFVALKRRFRGIQACWTASKDAIHLLGRALLVILKEASACPLHSGHEPSRVFS